MVHECDMESKAVEIVASVDTDSADVKNMMLGLRLMATLIINTAYRLPGLWRAHVLDSSLQFFACRGRGTEVGVY
jgi:hypothetical protein